MNKGKSPKIFTSTRRFMSKHSPGILVGLGITGMLTTTVLAVKATPKALKKIEEAKHEEHKDKLTPVETIKATWKCYIPAAVTGVTSVACLVGASSVHARRNAALATAYKLSETAFAEYQDKVVETIGEKKEKVVREAIDKDHIEKNPVSKNEVIITKKGSTLCYDYYSGRYFESDIDQCKKAINQLNSALLRNDYVSLNDLYDELGLEHVGLGDDMGWNIGRVGRELVKPRISSQIADDGRPCIVLACEPSPWHNYNNYI